MPDNQGTKLAGRVGTLYRNHCRLFWRIVMPVAIIAIILDIALLVFSVFVPDLALVRDALPPLKFLSLFVGGDIEIVLPKLLSVPTTVAIFVVKGLITSFLVPIWAILTTLLYLERVSVKLDALREAV
jgi:hypothetical protein